MSFDKTNSMAMSNSCENKSAFWAQFAHGLSLNFTCPATLTVVGACTALSNVNVDNNLTVEGSSKLNGDISAMSGLYVRGNARLGDATTDFISFYGQPAVQQQSAVANVNISNMANPSDTVNITGEINTRFATVQTTVNNILTRLRNLGLISN